MTELPFSCAANIPDGARLHLQPWAVEMINVALDVIENGGIHLYLLWPAKIGRLALLHSLVNLHRTDQGDMRGARTVVFPATVRTQQALQTVNVSGHELSAKYRSLWKADANDNASSGTQFFAATRSDAYENVLGAIQDIEHFRGQPFDPTFGALSPGFLFSGKDVGWEPSSARQLERALAQISKLNVRHAAHDAISQGWSDLAVAPAAMLTLHASTKKRHWEAAFADAKLEGAGRPDWLLLDASGAVAATHADAVHRIPDLLRVWCGLPALSGSDKTRGVLLATDDPKIYFQMRARLAETRRPFHEHIRTADATHAILAPDAVPAGQTPVTRSSVLCSVSIVDVQASKQVEALLGLASKAGNEDHAGHRLIIEVCHFVLRLSHLPAGLRDLEGLVATQGSFVARKYSWAALELAVREGIESGLFSSCMDLVKKQLEASRRLVTRWSDATPLAEALLTSLRELLSSHSHRPVDLVLAHASHQVSASEFLARRWPHDWAADSQRVRWQSLSSFSASLKRSQAKRHVILIGFNGDVLRFLGAEPELQAGTRLLLSHRQADSALRTVSGMIQQPELRPFKGRLHLLKEAIERQTAGLSKLSSENTLRWLAPTFDLRVPSLARSKGDDAYFAFHLEDGETVYAQSHVYVYDADAHRAFHRTAASRINVGDLIFHLSSELQEKLASALGLGVNSHSVEHQERLLIKIFHSSIKMFCKKNFGGLEGRDLSSGILARMRILEPALAADIQRSRVEYWLDLDKDDQKPHSAQDRGAFLLFCQALGFSEEDRDVHWKQVTGARLLNQHLGRELASSYAEVLLAPESALIYANIPRQTIDALLQEAVLNVRRVIDVTRPPTSPRRRSP